MTQAIPGQLGCYDPDQVHRQAPLIKAWADRWFRVRVEGLENVPTSPFVGVGNHSGASMLPDVVAWLSTYHSLSRQPRLLTLAHDGIFDHYPSSVGRWVAGLGGVRADEGLAARALDEGFAVQIYPGGDHDACRRFKDRHRIVFAGRTGYVKVAQRAKVPLVPVVACGGHGALIILREGRRLARVLGVHRSLRLTSFPLSLCLPWGLWLGPLPGYIPWPTQISLRVLPPISSKGTVQDIDRRVRAVMQENLNDMARRRCGGV